MSDITVKRIEEFDSPNGGGFCRARASLGVTAFGMQVEHFPPHFEHFPGPADRTSGSMGQMNCTGVCAPNSATNARAPRARMAIPKWL